MSGCTVLSHVSNTSTVEAHTDECVDIVCYHCGEKFSICNIHIKQVFERVDSRLLKSYGDFENNKAVLERVVLSLPHSKFSAALSTNGLPYSRCNGNIAVVYSDIRSRPKNGIQSAPPLRYSAKPAHTTTKNGVVILDGNAMINPELNPNYRIQMCRFGNDCKFGISCSYAHSIGELRTPSYTLSAGAALPQVPPVSVLLANANAADASFMLQSNDFPDLSAKLSSGSSRHHLTTTKNEVPQRHVLTTTRNISPLTTVPVSSSHSNDTYAFDAYAFDGYEGHLFDGLKDGNNAFNNGHEPSETKSKEGYRTDYSGSLLSHHSEHLASEEVSPRYTLPCASSSAIFDIESDLVPINTFTIVDWMRVYDMGVYYWSGNKNYWTDFAMHIPQQYMSLISSHVNYIRTLSGNANIRLETENLRGNSASFLVLKMGEPGEDAVNKSMVRALEAVSSLIQGAISAPAVMSAGSRRRGPQNSY